MQTSTHSAANNSVSSAEKHAGITCALTALVRIYRVSAHLHQALFRHGISGR